MGKRALAGWYTNPTDNRGYRFWDGSAWTAHVSPRPTAWGPGGDTTYDPEQLPMARLTPGGHEPVVYAWLGDGEPLTPEQTTAAAELERWYRMDQRCDSWWSTPMLLWFALYALLIAVPVPHVSTWLALPLFDALAYVILGAWLLALWLIWIMNRSRLFKARKFAWAAGLSWVVAPKPKRRVSWRRSLLYLPLLVILVFWAKSLVEGPYRRDGYPFAGLMVLCWAALAVIDAIGARRKWWVR